MAGFNQGNAFRTVYIMGAMRVKMMVFTVENKLCYKIHSSSFFASLHNGGDATYNDGIHIEK